MKTLESSLVAFLMSVSCIAGCDLFSTRVPEDPRRSGSTFIPATEPGITLLNLQNAISERNKENYLKCFIDQSPDKTFRFEPTQSAQSRYDFSQWTKSSEEQYYRNLIVAARSENPSRLDFYEQDTSRSGTSFLLRAKYYLTFPHTRSYPPGYAQGRLEFSIELDPRDNWWYIVHWIDYPDTSESTWSEFKGAFAN
jgi:hypothetical protein